jgi:hypothetical protein
MQDHLYSIVTNYAVDPTAHISGTLAFCYSLKLCSQGITKLTLNMICPSSQQFYALSFVESYSITP